jgi:23S rRNA (uridine2479-2'-O)-methyltransferase
MPMDTRTLPVHSENQWFQLAQTLKTNRQKRRHERLFFVEGVRSINQLRGGGRWQAEALLYCPERRLSGWAHDILNEVPAPTHLQLTPALMDKLSDREEGSEIIALVRMPRSASADIPVGAGTLTVLLDRPGNPGNLGSIIRSCDAFGVTGIVITGHAVDPFDPLVIRASAGAFFTQTTAHLPEQAELDAWLGRLEAGVPGLCIVGTSAKAARPVSDFDLTVPLVLCFGNETMGLSAWLKTRCHGLAGIPMQGTASSLNLACAVTAFLYETARQRTAAGRAGLC